MKKHGMPDIERMLFHLRNVIFFLLSFLLGHSFIRIWSYSQGAVLLLSKGEGGGSSGFVPISTGQINRLSITCYCYLIYARFLPQSQANSEFITISWDLNKLTPSLCQDSLRAEQFAFCTSTDVPSPLQLSCWQKSHQDKKDFTWFQFFTSFTWTLLKTDRKIVNWRFNRSPY